MSKALSLDLRERVLLAVAGGGTHREVASRFGVSAASVSRWRALERDHGDARPGPLGGDLRSGRVEAQTETILGLVRAAPDVTIEELRRALMERGLQFGFGTLQRFLIRHDMTRKKRLATPASRTGPTS